jgi:hypothetical protein
VSDVVVIDPDDRRSCLALILAAESSSWGRATHRATGDVGYLIPSQRFRDVYHAVTATECSCADFKLHQEPCKHVRAVRLYELLVSARSPRERK